MSTKAISSCASIHPPTEVTISKTLGDASSTAPSSLFSRPLSSSGTGDFTQATLPPSHTARTLVFCFESSNGLGHKYDSRNSTTQMFSSLLNRNGRDQQMCFRYYAEECHALCHRTCWDRVHSLQIVADKAFALNLDPDITRGYLDLMCNYIPGDKISLFGFSRGAYTARALAEMIHKVGLISQGEALSYAFAYSLYLREVDDEWHTSFAKFKEEANPMNIDIDFVGVWDTVSSVGDVIPWTLPFTRSNTSIRVFRQALALHERWAHLHPKFFEFDAQDVQDCTDVQEVWFAGSHRDIGGCAVPNDTPHSLGRIPLRWMVRECFRANTGIQFQAERVRDIGLDPASLYPIVKERPGPLQPRYHHLNTVAPRVPATSEEEHDVRDSLSPMHDQLTVYSPLWWAMELNANRRRVPLGPPSEWKDPGKSLKSIRMKHPRELFAPEQHSHIYIHPSVYTRKEAKRLRRNPEPSLC